MPVAVIINPIAGRRSMPAAEKHALARARLASLGTDAEVYVTTAPGHAAELARASLARGSERIVAWGGDGTVNEVAGPLIGARSVLGIVPGGSGDGFAGGLRIPRDPRAALEVALGARVLAIDVGWLGQRHFLNIAGIGSDAAVGQAFNHRRSRGMGGYIAVGFSTVWRYRPEAYEIDLDGQQHSGRRLLVAFANGPEYGNGFTLSPEADPIDGRLDAVIVDAGSVVRQLWRARRLLWLPGSPAAGVHRARVATARIAGERLVCHIDGEVFTASGTLGVRVEPGAIRIAVPARGTASDGG